MVIYVAFRMKAATVQKTIENFDKGGRQAAVLIMYGCGSMTNRMDGKTSTSNRNGDWSGRLNHAPMIGVDLAIAQLFASLILIIILRVVRIRWHISPAEQANTRL